MTYKEARDEVTTKVNTSNQARGHQTQASSTTDLNYLAHAMINDPTHEVPTYTSKASEDLSAPPAPNMRTPVKRYRDSLKPVVKSFGVDKLDADKLDTMQFSKEHAAALVEVGTEIIHDYMTAGRKFVMPITSPTETRMEMTISDAEEKVVTSHFKNAKGDTTTTKTKARKTIRSKNAVPSWLKERL